MSLTSPFGGTYLAEATATEAAPKISKADAVRAAVAEGIDTPEEGVAFILKKFGIEMGKPMWSSYRSQEKARAKKAGGGQPAAKRGRKPRAAAAPAPVPSGNGPAGLSIQVEAIKSLVDTLGVEQGVSIA